MIRLPRGFSVLLLLLTAGVQRQAPRRNVGSDGELHGHAFDLVARKNVDSRRNRRIVGWPGVRFEKASGGQNDVG